MPSYCGKALVGPFVKQITEELLKLVALTVLVDGMTSKQATILSHGKAVRTRKLKKADYVNKYQMRVRAVISDHDLDQPQGFVALTTAEALPQLFVLLLHLTNSLTGTTIVLHRIWTARL